MPKMSGYELCSKIKAGEATRDIPVMLVSSLSEAMDVIRGLEAGADNFLTKPYDEHHLVDRCRAILDNRALRSGRKLTVGIEVVFLGKRFTITSEKEQILDLLMSTFEDTVRANRELQKHRSELASAKEKLEEYALLLESRVHVSEEKYQTLLENASSGILVCDKEGIIREANREAGKIAGRPHNKLVGAKLEDLAPHLMGDEGALWRQLLKDGSGHLHTVAVRRDDGSRIWIDITASVITIDEEECVQVIWHDVTERKMLEDRLRRAQRMRYALLSENTRELIVFVDNETHKIVEANAAAVEAYGYAREELIGMSIEQIRATEVFDQIQSLFPRVAEGFTAETVALRKDGTTFPIEVVVRSGEVDGRTVSLSVGRDITERRENMRDLRTALEQALQANKLKSEFVATVSHEIRTPLNGIVGMSELLQRTELDNDQSECARTIHESSLALLKIINDILDFSKLESGRAQLEVVEFELEPVVNSVVELIGRAIKRESLTLMTYIAPGVPGSFRGDPGRLRQVLMNLVGNAVKFTEAGHILLSVQLGEKLADGRAMLRVSVADTGIGMDEETQRKLFVPFVQGDASTTRKFGGTGLGLSICKAYVELMNGDIHMESAPGEGTTVTFTMLLDIANERRNRAHPGILAGLRILVVDEDEDTRTMLSRYAEDWEMKTVAVSDGGSALEALRKSARDLEPFDVAIIGSLKGSMNELGLGYEIKRDVQIAGTHLMMLTFTDVEEPSKGVKAYGFETYLTKPLVQSHVYDRLVTMFAKKNGQEEAVQTHKDTGEILPLEAPLRVLVAEDNALNRRVAERQLSMLGCQIAMVENGTEVLAILEKEAFDVVLMDCNMPVMDGFEATRAIRELEQAGLRSRSTIVAMTANATQEDRDHCLAAGMDDYVSKPILMASLREVLMRATSQLTPAGGFRIE
jgi:PAS domain S-box-containing protein